MTNTMSPVIDRVQKLLALAKNAGSEAEATVAAQRAAELMARHELSEAELQIASGQARAPEEIKSLEIDKGKQRRVAWKSTIASAVAHSYGCKMYWWGAAIRVFGRLSATQAASYTIQYLWSEVDSLTEAAWAKSGVEPSKKNTKAWKNAFRVGAANAIAVRLWNEREARNNMVKVAIAMSAPTEQHYSSTNQALMIVNHEQQEVDEAYDNYSKGWRKSSYSIGRTSRGDAYRQGVTAGNSVAIGAQRAGLKRGTEVLP